MCRAMVQVGSRYVRRSDDQRRVFEEISQDLVPYGQWAPLRTLLVLIYNSSDLRDPEALERLSGAKEIGGERFDLRVVLA